VADRNIAWSARSQHVTLQLLWLEYKQANPDGLSYTQFCVHGE